MNNNIDYEEEINKVDRAMAQEGMPLTDEDKKNIKEVITGEKTYEEKINEIINETVKNEQEEGRRK